MDDMMAIYEITDRFGIDREHITVPLEKENEGEVTCTSSTDVKITAPATFEMSRWQLILHEELLRLGFALQEQDDVF